MDPVENENVLTNCQVWPQPRNFSLRMLSKGPSPASVAALNASLTSASIRCSRSLLNEGFWEDDDFNDMTS